MTEIWSQLLQCCSLALMPLHHGDFPIPGFIYSLVSLGFIAYQPLKII